jgi:hypothetical protein
LEAAEAEPEPTPFVAVTLKVYEVPGVRPVTLQVRAPDVVQVRPPGDAVTVYREMAEPLAAAAVQEIVACELPAVAVGVPGVPATAAGITALELADQAPVPAAFVAATWKMYDVPFTRPVTTYGELDAAVVATVQVEPLSDE